MFNKRGVDAVVATVLIIMITVAAVAIIWAVVIPMIKNTASSATAEKVSLTIETAGGYTVWDSVSEQAMVQVKRGIDGANLSAVKITFFSGKNSVYFLKAAPTSNSQATYKIPLWGFGKPTKVTIAPIFSKGEEGVVVSEITTLSSSASELELTAGENITNYSSGKNFTVPISYNTHSCIMKYRNGNEVNEQVSCLFPTFCTVQDFSGMQGFINYRCADGKIGSRCTDDRDCLNLRCSGTINYLDDYKCVQGNNGDYCDSNSDCDSGFCVYNYNGNAGAVCASGDVGDYCDDSADCKSGICGGWNGCTEGNIYDGCWYGSDCKSGICNQYDGTCTSGEPGWYCNDKNDCLQGLFCDRWDSICTTGAVGDGCYYREDCASGLICDSDTNQCATPRPFGSSCTQNAFQCASGLVCNTTNVCSGLLGSSCLVDNDCTSQYCNSTKKCANPSLLYGLMAYFPMNETSGLIAKDYSGLGNNVTCVNMGAACNFTTGKIGGAFSFDGSDDYTKKDSVVLPTGNKVTVQAWIYPRGYSSDPSYTGIVSWGSRYWASAFLLSIQNSGRPSMATWSNDFVPLTGSAATLNSWNHIVAVLNGQSIELYLNGQMVSNGTLSYLPNIVSTQLGIGITDYPGRYFKGSIDEVAIWNRSLNSTEIAYWYNSGNGRAVK